MDALQNGAPDSALYLQTMLDAIPNRPLSDGQIAFMAAFAHRDELAGRRRGRPSKKCPPVGISVAELAQSRGISKSLLDEAIFVDRNLSEDDPRRARILQAQKQGRLELTAVYDDLKGIDRANERDRRFTPAVCRESLHALWGSDFLDAASEHLPDGTNPMHADQIYTKDDDGLQRAWAPRTWCNVPFSKKTDWIAKAIRERAQGNGSYVVLPDDMSTVATHEACREADEILLVLGRFDYLKPDGTSEKRPNFGTLILSFGLEIGPLADELKKRDVESMVLPGELAFHRMREELDVLRDRLTKLEEGEAA